MISNKEDYDRFLKQDRIALNCKTKYPRPFKDEIWKFQILLRKVEYYLNCKKGIWNKIVEKYYKFRFHQLSVRLGLSIAPNVFEEGLSIAHYGTIVVHANASVGKNCRIQEGVTIGATNNHHESAIIGDNCFIGSGAKIIGAITIANDVAIGAGAVVIGDITEPGTTWAGVPARKISDNNSHSNLNSALFTNDVM